MSLRYVLLAIQSISIVGLFLESWLVFRKMKDPLHSWLLLSTISVLINNLGYLLELTSTSMSEYMASLKFSYFGRVWFAFFLLIFVSELVKVRVPNLVKRILMLVHMFIFIAILTTPMHKLYYTDLSFEFDGIFPRFTHGNGILHHILMSIMALYVVIGTVWLARALYREKDKKAKRRDLMVLLAVITEGAFFVMEIVGIPGLKGIYDVTAIGYFIGTIFMLIAILSYDLLGTGEVAKEFFLDRLAEGIIAVDNNGVIQYYNEPAKKLYPSLSKQGEAIVKTLSKAVKDGEIITIEDRMYSPEENDLMHGGVSVGKLYALVDETEHYRYMEELEEQRRIADSANEAKSRFLANMSHEIRTPINAVLGMDEMIIRETSEKPIRAYAKDIMSAGKTLLSLINDILDLSKVEEGKMEIIPVQYDLSTLINDLVNMIRDRAKKKGLHFELEVDEKIPHLLYGDEIRIRQCVMNLLTNAVKYTEKGTVLLRLTFSKEDEKKIKLGFFVRDSGIGMKEEDMEKLFSPYKRIEEKRNRNVEGTGLGMSITRQLLELMGTSLSVESTYGEGSEFYFYVEQEVVSWEEIGPNAGAAETSASEEAAYQELFHAPDAKILVVDDTEMNLTVITGLLKKTKIGIDTAMSGKDAIALSKENSYDVIFIDHMMPDMDGIETLEHLRAETMNAEKPCVALTANAVSGARERYLKAGFNSYLSKPVDGKKLEELLRSLLPKEKVLEPEPDEETAEPVPAKETSMDWVKDIPEIDAGAGLKNCGTEEGYASVLNVFHRTAEAKADEIETMYQKGDIENYTIKVHALKSSARIIGASDLSKLAEQCEAAGKNQDEAFIDEHTDRLLLMYRSLDKKLSAMDKDREALPEISPVEMKEAWQTILEISDSMDYGLMDQIIKDLKGYRLGAEDEKNLLEVEKALTELDWEKIRSLAEKGMK